MELNPRKSVVVCKVAANEYHVVMFRVIPFLYSVSRTMISDMEGQDFEDGYSGVEGVPQLLSSDESR